MIAPEDNAEALYGALSLLCIHTPSIGSKVTSLGPIFHWQGLGQESSRFVSDFLAWRGLKLWLWRLGVIARKWGVTNMPLAEIGQICQCTCGFRGHLSVLQPRIAKKLSKCFFINSQNPAQPRNSHCFFKIQPKTEQVKCG